MNKQQNADGKQYDMLANYINNQYRDFWGKEPEKVKKSLWNEFRRKMDMHHKEWERREKRLFERNDYIMKIKKILTPEHFDDKGNYIRSKKY